MTRRFAFIQAADIADYSLMMAQDESATISLVHELRDRLLEPVVERHEGEVLKRMGDGWIIAYPSVAASVLAALEIQNGLAEHPKTRLRIGIHMGDIVRDEADLYGAGVNIACRLQTEAPPGGVLVSADIYNQLSEKQCQGFSDAGTFKLKNIPRPIQCFQWRPEKMFVGSRSEEVPVIGVEKLVAAPATEETAAAADDLHEQIVHGLSRRTGIRVRDVSVGSNDKTTYTLRGRFRASGGRARVNLSLILRDDASTVWADVFEGDATDLFGFCDDVSAQVDAKLRLFVNSLDNNRIGEIPDENLSVSELRTRAAGLFYECTIPDLERCISVMDRARRLNPKDGMSLSMWAIGVVMRYKIRFEPLEGEILTELIAAHDRAVELMPQSDFVFFTRCLFRSITERDPEKVMSDARRCYELSPNYPQAHIGLGYAFILTEDFDNAVKAMRKGTELRNDPYWTYRRLHMAVAQFCGEDFEGTISTLKEMIDLKPSVRGFRKLLILSLKALGRDTEAQKEEQAAALLDDGENFHVQEPTVPDSHLWLREALAPGSGGILENTK
ncbi:adenylate/guanylate cyclase domain-containing protein [Aestuariivita boseongensis]|uniref:adenylate/guanylate cyclase domain-containing protein n=1 Tax=Aestuariivita boseongensis TaxID=1470562 RepID=UPI0006808100|nr:adenylate/guanylate cyclase domain-containing protein [Aestuariivita boseongensis]